MGTLVNRLQQVKTTSQVATDRKQNVNKADATIFGRVESRNLQNVAGGLNQLTPQESLLMDIMIQQHEGLDSLADGNKLPKAEQSSFFGKLGISSTSLSPAMIAAWPVEKISVLSFLGSKLSSVVSFRVGYFFSISTSRVDKCRKVDVLLFGRLGRFKD